MTMAWTKALGQAWTEAWTRFLALLILLGMAATVAAVPPYEVDVTSFGEPHGFVVGVPRTKGGDQGPRSFPAIVFGHGLCGRAQDYAAITKAVAERGYVVVANTEQEDCGNAGSIFSVFSSDPFPKLRESSDGGVMVANMEEEVDWLLSNESVPFDGRRLGLLGHSMGGGAVIDLAAKLEYSKPGLVKGVVALAPWNGINDASVPSSVAGKITAPLLLVCSKMDQLCPCSGKVGAATNMTKNWASQGAFDTIFKGKPEDWYGGVDAIFDAAAGGSSNGTTIVRLDNGGHFALAGITEAQLRQLSAKMGVLPFFASAAIE